LVAKAFADGRPYLVEDFPTSTDSNWWLERGVGQRAGIAGATPIFREGLAAGVFLYFLKEPSMLATAVAGYIDEMVHALSFTLDRLQLEHEKDRIRRIVFALSESNEAILRAETREKMYQLVCEAGDLPAPPSPWRNRRKPDSSLSHSPVRWPSNSTSEAKKIGASAPIQRRRIALP
jgi:hypothetical protein